VKRGTRWVSNSWTMTRRRAGRNTKHAGFEPSSALGVVEMKQELIPILNTAHVQRQIDNDDDDDHGTTTGGVAANDANFKKCE
jgi:hypothetical protein